MSEKGLTHPILCARIGARAFVPLVVSKKQDWGYRGAEQCIWQAIVDQSSSADHFEDICLVKLLRDGTVTIYGRRGDGYVWVVFEFPSVVDLINHVYMHPDCDKECPNVIQRDEMLTWEPY